MWLCSVESCRSTCASKGFTFAGVQYKTHCFCDNTVGTYGRISTANCNTRCAGNLGELCGGGYANGVWRAVMPLTRMEEADEAAPGAAPVVNVNADGSSQTQLSTGALVGIVIGAVALVAVLALVVAGALMFRRRRQMLQQPDDVSYKASSADS